MTGRFMTVHKRSGDRKDHDWAAAESVGDFVFPWYTAGEKEQTTAKLLEVTI